MLEDEEEEEVEEWAAAFLPLEGEREKHFDKGLMKKSME